jgi:cytoskeletal protein CcmA (bactofilin family)
MAETRIPRGSQVRLGVVDGDLRADQHVRIQGDPKVTVKGDVRFDGSAVVTGGLECRRFRADDGTVEIAGDLIVEEDLEGRDCTLEVAGALRARRVDVDRSLSVKGPAEAEKFEVGGVLEGSQTLTARSVSVGGKFRLAGQLTADSVEAGGSAELGDVAIESLSVGGAIRMGGGQVRGSIEVGGRFLTERPLQFGSLDVGGLAEFREDGRGGSVDIGGILSANKDLAFDDLEIGGLGRIQGNGTGRNVEIGGKFDVQGSLTLTGRLEVGGAVVIGEALQAESLEIGGKLEARRAVIASAAEIGGQVNTREGLKADRIRLERKSRAYGPLVGGTVDLNRGSRVEDVYGERISLEEKVEARRVFGANVRMREGAHAEEVTYTGTLELAAGATVSRPPQKVASLPAFPL